MTVPPERRSSDALLAGAATATITPPLSVSLDGEYRDRRPTKVFSDLAARALVLDDGDGPVALLTIDACRLGPSVGNEIAAMVEREAGIAPERLMLTGTHTHGAPALFETPWFGPDRAYLDELVAQAAGAVARAREQLRPTRMLTGQGAAPALVFNRRFRMRDGSARTNPGLRNPDVVEPLGPVDPAVDVVRFEDLAGRTIAHLVTFALHVATVTDGLSGDYPEVLSRLLQKRDGVEAPVLFAMACAGDINRVDVRVPDLVAGQAGAELIGAALAEEVTRSLVAAAAPAAGTPLRYASATVALTLRTPGTGIPDDADSGATLTIDREDPHDQAAATGAATAAIEGYRDWQLRRLDPPEMDVVVQALALGPIAYVALPGEIFAALGLDLKRRSPFPQTLIGTLNASASTYVPTREAYDEGGYEVLSSLVEPGSGERLVDVAIGLLEGLHAQR